MGRRVVQAGTGEGAQHDEAVAASVPHLGQPLHLQLSALQPVVPAAHEQLPLEQQHSALAEQIHPVSPVQPEAVHLSQLAEHLQAVMSRID